MTLIPDLQVLRDPIDSSFRVLDLAPVWFDLAGVPPTARVYAVGWLGDTVESRGGTPEACIRVLLRAYAAGHRFSDGTMGSHTCEVCGPTLPPRGYHHPFAWNGIRTTLYGHGHHIVVHGQAAFVCPALILHYIVEHQYRPPAQFIDAVLMGHVLIPRKELIVQVGAPFGRAGRCEECGQPARYYREELLLCERCYQGRVPSWTQRPTDRLDAPMTSALDILAEGGARSTGPANTHGTALLVTCIASAILFSVETVLTARTADWADFVIAAPVAIISIALSLRLWHRMSMLPREDSDAD